MSDATDVSLGGETLKGTAAKFTMALAGFVGTVVFARVLGPTAFGAYYLLLRLSEFVDRPVVGWSVAAKRRFAQDGFPRSEVVGTQFVVCGGWTALVALGAVAFAGPVRDYVGLDAAPLLLVVLLAAHMLFVPFDPLVKGRGLVGAATWIDTLRSYLTLPLQLALVFLGFGAAGMVYGLAAATVLAAPLLWYYVAVAPAVPSADTLRSLAAYARYSTPSTVVGKAYSNLDVLLLGWFLTTDAVADYEVALKLTMAALFVADAAGEGLMGRVSTLRSRGEAVATDVSNTLAYASVLAIPMFFGALAIPRPLVVTLYTAQFASAAPLLVGLALYRVFQTQTKPLVETVNGLDRPRVAFRVAAAVLTVNVALAVVLLRLYGPVGVVAATVFSEALRYVLLGAFLKRSLPDVRLLPRALFEQVGAAVAMYAVVTVLRRLVPVRSWLDLVFVVGVGAVVYGLVLVAVSPGFRATVGGVLRSTGLDRYAPAPVRRW